MLTSKNKKKITNVKLPRIEMRQQTGWPDLIRQNSLLLKKNHPAISQKLKYLMKNVPASGNTGLSHDSLSILTAFYKEENLLALGKAVKHFWLPGSEEFPKTCGQPCLQDTSETGPGVWLCMGEGNPHQCFWGLGLLLFLFVLFLFCFVA